jgi:hypothetical protein
MRLKRRGIFSDSRGCVHGITNMLNDRSCLDIIDARRTCYAGEVFSELKL